MHALMLFALAVGIGIIAGLRSLTAPAVICWMAHLNVIHLDGTPFHFMASTAGVALFTILALAEIVGDKLPKTPARTAIGPFGVRIVMGALSGGALLMAANASAGLGALAGVIGAAIGTWGGYFARTGTVKATHAPDFVIALLEDFIAIAGGIFIVWHL
jgi:uncharacterized membrane protein